MPFLSDATFLILIPAMLLAAWAQFMVSNNYKKYSDYKSRAGRTGGDVARALLSASGVHDVEVLPIKGQLTDHYDPRSGKVMLSEGVYASASISAISIAAHETGHAIQHATGYAPLNIRAAIVPAANISSQLSIPIFMLGMFFGSGGQLLMNLGIFLFTGAVIFQIITLPVEFDASNRAMAMLENGNYLTEEEIKPARNVLNAAAMTYVAAAFMSVAQLLRLVMLSGRRRN